MNARHVASAIILAGVSAIAIAVFIVGARLLTLPADQQARAAEVLRLGAEQALNGPVVPIIITVTIVCFVLSGVLPIITRLVRADRAYRQRKAGE